jgi:competence protein ComEC
MKKLGIVSAVLTLLLAGCSSTNQIPSASAKSGTTIATGSGLAAPVKNDGKLHVYYLDVGQGDSIYIKTPAGDDILIDGGNNDQGNRLVRYLNNLHVDDIEVMVGTHPDADHVGGLDSVLKSFKVKSVYFPKVSHNTKTFEDFLRAVKGQGLGIKTAKAGVALPLNGVDAKFVGPVNNNYKSLNDFSAVVHLSYGKNSFIFTGDAEYPSEKDMIDSQQELKSDVLKVGHHGSNSSTSVSFLKAVNPQYAVISVGKDNKSHHPTQKTLNKFEKANIKIFRTDEQGTVEAISDGKKLSFKTER